jgi:hypothetical protein
MFRGEVCICRLRAISGHEWAWYRRSDDFSIGLLPAVVTAALIACSQSLGAS